MKRDHRRLHPDQILFAFLIPTPLQGMHQEQYLSDFLTLIDLEITLVFKTREMGLQLGSCARNIDEELLMNNFINYENGEIDEDRRIHEYSK